MNERPVCYTEKDIHEAFIHAYSSRFYYIRYQHLVKIILH